MTTNFHAPIPSSPPQEATAAVFNSRFATLDAAIDDNRSVAVSNNIELVIAREPYASLKARLDAMTGGYSGGNIATLTNGTAAAGQKTVTVDSTTGFLAGAYVAYMLVGGDVEYNLIANVASPTSLTLTTNIGTGGIANDVYIGMISISEYQAANNIPHAGTLTLPQAMQYANGGVRNVLAYGATGDGTTDDHAALNAAWAALSDGETLLLPAGIYAVTDTVEWMNADNITILAHNATIKAKTGSNFASKAVLDMGGSQYCNVVGLRLDCTLTSLRPDVGLALHRTNDAVNGGSNCFDNCWFTGSYDLAVVSDQRSELAAFQHCRFLTNVGGIPCYFSTSIDATQPGGSASNVCKRFYDCTFLDYSGASTGQVLVQIGAGQTGVTKELSFRDCYMAMSGAGRAIFLSGESMYGLVLDNIRVEGNDLVDQSDSRLLYLDESNATHACQIQQIIWTIDSDFVIEIAGASSLRTSNLSLLYPLAGTTKWIHVSGSLYYNFIVVGDAETISIDGGDVAQVNFVVSFGDGATPFTGAGTHDGDASQTNITATLYDTHSGMGFARRRTEYITLDAAAGTTPSVGKRDLIFLNYNTPTTITDFIDQVNGQELTILTSNGNITIDDGTNIVLKGRTNWTMPTIATLTLRDVAGVWYETGRMDPS